MFSGYGEIISDTFPPEFFSSTGNSGSEEVAVFVDKLAIVSASEFVFWVDDTSEYLGMAWVFSKTTTLLSEYTGLSLGISK